MRTLQVLITIKFLYILLLHKLDIWLSFLDSSPPHRLPVLYVLIQSSSLVPWLSSSSSSSFGAFQLLQFHWNRKKSLYTFRLISPFTFIHSPCQSLPILFNIIIFSYSYDSFPFHIPFPFLFSYGLSVLLPYSFLTCQYIYIFTECLVLGIIFAI